MRPSPDSLLGPDESRRSDASSGAPDPLGRTYTPKVELSLSPEMPASEALAALFEHLLGVLCATVPGLSTRRSEVFLHDYRVAVRRTRSALGRFGEFLPPETLEWAKRFFADLGRRTGNARDLDVLLLEMPGYTEPLPAGIRRSLSRTVGQCEHDVRLEYAALAKWFASPLYRDELERWERAIGELAKTPCERTIAEAAAQAIRQTAAKVFWRMEKLGKAKKERRVHRLRIACKKLRYSLEFSRSLTPGGEVEQLITSLKRLQDVLGTHNDLVVHEAKLRDSADGSPDAELENATDRLLAEIEARRRKSRKRVRAAVMAFQVEGPPGVELLLERLGQPTEAASRQSSPVG